MNPTMLDELVPWLRKRIDMAIQCANALPHAVGGLLSQFSPAHLLSVHQAHGLLLNHLVHRTDAAAQFQIQVLATAYQLCPGYREEWAPTAAQAVQADSAGVVTKARRIPHLFCGHSITAHHHGGCEQPGCPCTRMAREIDGDFCGVRAQ